MIFDVGDRVRFYEHYRAKGPRALPGGWGRVWRTGTVKQVNHVTVDILPDGAPSDVDSLWRRIKVERVEYLEEQRDYA